MTGTNAAPLGIVEGVSSARGATNRLVTALLWVQGVYYLVTGVWPLVSIETFQRVTGRKTDHLVTEDEADHWLVMAVGVLVTTISLALLSAAMRKRRTVEVTLLAMGSAIGLTAIDVIYVSRQVISPIYLVDAAVEILILLGWIVSTVLAWTLRQIKRPTSWPGPAWVKKRMVNKRGTAAAQGPSLNARGGERG